MSVLIHTIRRARNWIDPATLEMHGTTAWPWFGPRIDILAHLCPRCARRDGARLRASIEAYLARQAEAWESLPAEIRQAVATAHGGNRTVIRCLVPGRSSRFARCVMAVASEHGLGMAEVGRRLLRAGRTHVCGHPLPAQWANLREVES